MKRWTGVAAALAVLASASGASAQDPEHPNSISLSVGSSTTIGYWMPVSARADLGVLVGASFADGENSGGTEQTSWSVRAGPALKLYATRESPFRPYTYGELFFAFGRTESETGGGAESSLSNRDLAANVGLGLDWFPTDRVSIGGHVGLSGAFTWSEIESGAAEADSDGFHFNTLSSGIRVHLYL